MVKLLIIDEVHLLHSDRGPVVEAVVARTLRQVSLSYQPFWHSCQFFSFGTHLTNSHTKPYLIHILVSIIITNLRMACGVFGDQMGKCMTQQ